LRRSGALRSTSGKTALADVLFERLAAKSGRVSRVLEPLFASIGEVPLFVEVLVPRRLCKETQSESRARVTTRDCRDFSEGLLYAAKVVQEGKTHTSAVCHSGADRY
jgi:hypothetical protein